MRSCIRGITPLHAARNSGKAPASRSLGHQRRNRGYLKKKGEHIASQEDLAKLISQVEATTRVSKSIEEKISGDAWVEKRLWEFKRDTLVEFMNRCQFLYYTATKLTNYIRELRQNHHSLGKEDVKELESLLGQLQSESEKFAATMAPTFLVAGNELCNEYLQLMSSVGRLNISLEDEAGIRSVADIVRQIAVCLLRTINLLQREFGLPVLSIDFSPSSISEE